MLQSCYGRWQSLKCSHASFPGPLRGTNILFCFKVKFNTIVFWSLAIPQVQHSHGLVPGKEAIQHTLPFPTSCIFYWLPVTHILPLHYSPLSLEGPNEIWITVLLWPPAIPQVQRPSVIAKEATQHLSWHPVFTFSYLLCENIHHCIASTIIL